MKFVPRLRQNINRKKKTRKQRKYKLRKQRGGDDDTFFVYTTGFSDALTRQPGPGSNSIIDRWLNRGILDTFLGNIPPSYTKIQITHYDPVNIENAHEILCSKELKRPRIKASNYVNAILDIPLLEALHSDSKNYILLDQAHVFTPTGNTREYEYSESGDPYSEKTKRIVLNLVYIGYFGHSQLQPDIFKVKFTKFFEVRPDGTVVSFIDKLKEKGYPYGIALVNTIIDEILPIARSRYKIQHRYDNMSVSSDRVRLLAEFHTYFNNLTEIIYAIIGEYLNTKMWGEIGSSIDTLKRELDTFY